MAEMPKPRITKGFSTMCSKTDNRDIYIYFFFYKKKTKEEKREAMQTFQDERSFSKRQQESAQLMSKHPDRVPVIVYGSEPNILPYLKLLVLRNSTVGALLCTIRKQQQLTAEASIFLFVNNQVIPPVSSLVSQVYHEHRHEDGFLYITYALENVFGGSELAVP